MILWIVLLSFCQILLLYVYHICVAQLIMLRVSMAKVLVNTQKSGSCVVSNTHRLICYQKKIWTHLCVWSYGAFYWVFVLGFLKVRLLSLCPPGIVSVYMTQSVRVCVLFVKIYLARVFIQCACKTAKNETPSVLVCKIKFHNLVGCFWLQTAWKACVF